jgi:hypothetical protein
MVYVIFEDDLNTVVQCPKIKYVDAQHVLLTFVNNALLDTSGFTFSFDSSGKPISGDYRTYTTVYSVDDKTVVYSNDGSKCLAFDVSALSVTAGATGQITATCDGTPVWTSSDTSVATVDSTGLITGVSAGTSTISATYLGITETCMVTVAV